MSLSICTEKDVYQRFGGQAALTQALDPKGTGSYDLPSLQSFIQQASEEVAARANVVIQVQAIAKAVAQGKEAWSNYPLLVYLSADLTVVKVWRYGTSGQAMPDQIRELEMRVLDDLEKIRKLELSIGAPAAYPTHQANITVVDMDPGNRRMSLKGFEKWFA